MLIQYARHARNLTRFQLGILSVQVITQTEPIYKLCQMKGDSENHPIPTCPTKQGNRFQKCAMMLEFK